jgi:hypothetical protein
MSGETFERRVTSPALGAASLACGRPVTSELRLISPPQIAHSKVFSSYALPKSGCGERRPTFMVCPLQIMRSCKPAWCSCQNAEPAIWTCCACDPQPNEGLNESLTDFCPLPGLVSVLLSWSSPNNQAQVSCPILYGARCTSDRVATTDSYCHGLAAIKRGSVISSGCQC